MNIIDTLSLDTIKTCLEAAKGGVITRLSYMTELPLKAEFKKLGYKVIKVTDTSVRFGVDYSKIARVIAKKADCLAAINRNCVGLYAHYKPGQLQLVTYKLI